MASTYTTSLKIQEIGSGEQSGSWGTTTNTNWTLIEQAVAGVQSIVMANANYTLTNLNGVSDEARNMVLVVQGTNSAIYQVIAPQNQPKMYVISNQTTGGYAITIGASSGSLVTIPNGVTAQVYTDGTNFYSAQTGSAGNFNVNGNLTAAGVTDTGALSAASLTVSGAASLAATSFSVSPTAPTPTTGDNSTNVATTAFTTAAITAATGSLGTMSTQNANAVAITGGTATLSGITVNGTGTFVSPNSGSTGGVQIRQNAGGGNTVLQFTNNAGSAEYGDISTTPGGVINITPATAGQVQVSGNKVLTTATKLGLGITGEVWHDVTGSRASGTTYPNSLGYPIMVSINCVYTNTYHGFTAYVDGILVTYSISGGNNFIASQTGSFIVPPGSTYVVTYTQITNWVELY